MPESQVRELLYLIRCGEDEALNEIFHYCYKLISIAAYKLCYADFTILDYDDLIQVGYSHLPRILWNYREDLGVRFSTYLNTCVGKKMYSAMSGMKKNDFKGNALSLDDYSLYENRPLHEIVADECGSYSPTRKVESQERLLEVNKAMQMYNSPRDIEIYWMFMNGYSEKEIAQSKHMTLTAVYNTIHRVKNRLKAHLK